MRTAARVDATHLEICQALRDAGFSVRSTASIGKNFPDICVGHNGRNYLIECKDGAKHPSRRKLSEGQKKFQDDWRGYVVTLNSVDEAIEWASQTHRLREIK